MQSPIELLHLEIRVFNPKPRVEENVIDANVFAIAMHRHEVALGDWTAIGSITFN